MINKREVVWGLIGAISLSALIVTVWQLFSTANVSWASVLAVVMVGGIAGGIPYLPPKIMSKYRVFWLSLGLVAWGILIFWRGERSLRWLGISVAWLVATIGHFGHKWRSQNVLTALEIMPEDSNNAKP